VPSFNIEIIFISHTYEQQVG